MPKTSKEMKVYLDNCCFNRPYDDQSNLTNSLEAQAKLHIQMLIKENKLQLASSFVLEYENSCNPYFDRKVTVSEFVNRYATDYISRNEADAVIKHAEIVMAQGVKMKDACHIVCAEMMNCDYLLTTDKRMLKYKDEQLTLINPIDFVELLNEETEDEH